MLSFLVAFRDTDDGARLPLWNVVRTRIEAAYPDAEIVVGTDDGVNPFHKTLALNRAASRASGDVLALWDADTWIPAGIAEAVEWVRATGGWARPYGMKVKANEQATRWVLEQGTDWDGTLDHRPFGRAERLTHFPHAPPFVLTREAWDAIGGADERIAGWGQDDVAMALALRWIVGRQRVFHNNALHLWHPRIGISGNDLWAGQESQAANIAVVRTYQRARTPDAMRALIEERAVTV